MMCVIGIDFKYYFVYNELVQFDKLEFECVSI